MQLKENLRPYVQILAQGTCLVLAGQNLPQRTLNPINHPADCYVELQKAMGALSYANFNGFY